MMMMMMTMMTILSRFERNIRRVRLLSPSSRTWYRPKVSYALRAGR